MAVHGEIKKAFGRSVAAFMLDRGERTQVHAAGEGLLARGDNDAFDVFVFDGCGHKIVDQ